MSEYIPNDIEVTPEMIEAGNEVSCRFVDREWEAHDADWTKMVLTKIYVAMSQARHNPGQLKTDPFPTLKS